MEEKIVKWLVIVMLACIAWAMVRPVLMDKATVQRINQVINAQAAQIQKNATDVRNLDRDIADIRKEKKEVE